MSECLFCKIIAGEIPATIVYEDHYTVAFEDIDPQAPVHILVIPKVHVSSIENIQRTQQNIFQQLCEAIQQVVQRESLTDAGYRVVINSGADGGQAVDHLHAHVLAGRSLQWPPG